MSFPIRQRALGVVPALASSVLLSCGARAELRSPCWQTLNGAETVLIFAGQLGNGSYEDRPPPGSLAAQQATTVGAVAVALGPDATGGGFYFPHSGISPLCSDPLPIASPVQRGGISQFASVLRREAAAPTTEFCGCYEPALLQMQALVTDEEREYILVPMLRFLRCANEDGLVMNAMLLSRRFSVAIVGVLHDLLPVVEPIPRLNMWALRTEFANPVGPTRFYWSEDPQSLVRRISEKVERNKRCVLRLPSDFGTGTISEVRATTNAGDAVSLSESRVDGWSLESRATLVLHGPACDNAVQTQSNVQIRTSACRSR